MKKKILLSTAFVFTLSSTPHLATAGVDRQTLFTNFLIAISNSTAASKICRKANTFDKTFSIRSFDGLACTVPIVAAFAETVCPTVPGENYQESKCHKISLTTLKGRDPKTALAEEISGLSSKVKSEFCLKAGNVSSALAVACTKASSGSSQDAAKTTVTTTSSGRISTPPPPPPAPSIGTQNNSQKAAAKAKLMNDLTQEKKRLETLQKGLSQAPKVGVQPMQGLQQGAVEDHKAALLEEAQKLNTALKDLRTVLEKAQKKPELTSVEEKEIERDLQGYQSVEDKIEQDLGIIVKDGKVIYK
ncbi:MAG: hypothetical protein JNK42_01075 [Caedimonas sp.]|nr:hypothetical protein [Caedimonas sp.]